MVDYSKSTSSRRSAAAPARSYAELFRASPAARIVMIKGGISAAEAKRIIGELHFAQGVAFSALKLSPATVNRRASRNEALSPSESERVLGVARLIGQLEVMVEESGSSGDFDSGAWMSRWLKEPLPTLGGSRPIDLLDTMEGQSLVSNALAQIQSGAYG